jgi:hypothetical protein
MIVLLPLIFLKKLLFFVLKKFIVCHYKSNSFLYYLSLDYLFTLIANLTSYLTCMACSHCTTNVHALYVKSYHCFLF